MSPAISAAAADGAAGHASRRRDVPATTTRHLKRRSVHRQPAGARDPSVLWLTFCLAVLAGLALGGLGLVSSPLLVAVILSATSLGIILPVLSIPVVAGKIGVELGVIRPENYVAMVAAGLLSVV